MKGLPKMATQGELLPFAREVIDTPVQDELGESFLAYSLSVITSRAIPDVRDGLKPVQRRILYSMRQMRLMPEKPHRKCAHVVGDVMAKYHPHGDGAIYDTLVRLGQDFAKQVTVIDPQGNFGSLDDPPAAYRYTECRLTPAALDLLGEIDEETVDWRATYDGETQEPGYLPALLPNLLVNGTSGIAVGMATNMAPHNLPEVYKAIKLVMNKRRPKPTTEELLAVLPGPDFPSGGKVVIDNAKEIYETGKGSIKVRAKADIVKVTKARKGIEITELPYLVGVERVVAKIKQLRENGKINGISDVKNLSDRKSGLKLLIECKTAVNPKLILEKLYKLTPLEESFGFNNVVLVNGVPTVVGLYDLCLHYCNHRLDVIVRRSQYRLHKAQERLHIIEGLLIAIDNIDTVVAIIRSSKNSAEASERLMNELGLSKIQAEYVLELKLRRLTALAYDELTAEKQELVKTIEALEKLLGSEARQRTLVLKELKEIVDKYGKPRRSKIISAADIETVEQLEEIQLAELSDDPCVVSLTASGLIGREQQGQSRSYTLSRHDVIRQTLVTSLAQKILAISSKGRVFSTLAHDIADVGGRSRGKTSSDTFALDKGETIVTICSPAGGTLVFVSSAGKAKQVTRETLSSLTAGRSAMKLADDERLVAAIETNDQQEHVVAVTAQGQALRTPWDAISVQGASAKGVAFFALKGNDRILTAALADPSHLIVTVTDMGTAKATSPEEIPVKGRGTGGVRITKFKDESRIDMAWIGTPDRAICIVGQSDAPSRPANKPEPLKLRGTKRDGPSKATEHRILALGSIRW